MVLILFAWVLSFADGYMDPYYIRFTSPKQKNLIIGTSRAAQGLQPKVFNNILGQNFYNYAFTIEHSPFGPIYFESIKKKLKKDVNNGIFIVTIDPWSISSITSNPNDSTNFREINLCVGNTSIVNMEPNFLYLLRNPGDNYFKSIFMNNSGMFLHSDGWLEVSLKMDSIKINERINWKIDRYRTVNLPKHTFSSLRLEYLIKTVEFLSNHGRVYLVRLPAHPEIMKIDNELIPDFGKKIEEAVSLSSGYLDMSDECNEYSYTDGNHLYKDSGRRVSEKIAEWIKKGNS